MSFFAHIWAPMIPGGYKIKGVRIKKKIKIKKQKKKTKK